jgi:hypothetical protein
LNVKFRFVCATRESYDDFFLQTPLGRSLSIYRAPFAELLLFDSNTKGLPALYNEALRDAASDPATLIFIHDDVHLCDFFWYAHLAAGLSNFDIIGVAGNRRRLPAQPAWRFIDEQLTVDSQEHLSGIVAHGNGFPPGNLSCYGPPGQEVKLLDGVLLAARSETLIDKQLRFDERFDFHFYDLDFCRQAERKRVRMGTWPLSIIHESEGKFGTPAWREAYVRYRQKWKD